ncbi:MAG: SPOR domain-containing protein [Rhodobacteraceae bacterium]|nr:SPOR domain-containing protein [Paracoccaceae bacterium]
MQNLFKFTNRLTIGLLASAALLAISACEDAAGTSVQSATPVFAADGATTIEQEVERPDIFSVTEEALWDGRPSLGGIWVAYPNTTDPERVVITNTETGDSVIGALFRRERDNPGPSIQLSSDAASAIGVLAGSPTEISIVVLRRETIEIAPPPEPEPVPEPEIEPEAETENDTATLELGALVEEVLADTPIAAEVAENLDTATAAAAPAVNRLLVPTKPYIQIGTFSEEENAENLVAQLGSEGVQAVVITDTTDERTLYRVVSGPASTRSERNERMRIIKGLGFTDAFSFRL